MNSKLERLHEYPFTKLNRLLQAVEPATDKALISLAIGEPQHTPPAIVLEALKANLDTLNRYPTTAGTAGLRSAIARWLERRFTMPPNTVDAETMVLPAVGTREALFAIAQVVVDSSGEGSDQPLVLMPAPFYQIYEGAAIMAGAKPHYLPCTEVEGFIPCLETVSAEQWQRCQLIYVCSPSNPTGAVLSGTFYQRLIELSDQYDFVIASDECYSEIYADEQSPPLGLLEWCAKIGRSNFSRCLVFNSLSKRSSAAGLRSGFIAGDAKLIKAFLLYRTYHGSAMSLHHQHASEMAWQDESHVIESRESYRQKMQAFQSDLTEALDVTLPAAGFCVWLKTPIDDEQFALELFRQQQVKVLPGRYLARELTDEGAGPAGNPGEGYVRIALVGSLENCKEAARRIAEFVVTFCR